MTFPRDVTCYIAKCIDRFPLDIPVIRILTEPIESIVSSIFIRVYTLYEERQKRLRKDAKIKRISFVKENLEKTLAERTRVFDISYPEKEKKLFEYLRKIEPTTDADFIPEDGMRSFIRKMQFIKIFTSEEQKILFPDMEEILDVDPKIAMIKKKQIKQDKKKADEEYKRMIFKKDNHDFEKIDNFSYQCRISFKVCCIFFCVYMAYPGV